MATITWLKKIFSAQTISIIIGLLSLLIAYISFTATKSGEIQLTLDEEFPNFDSTKHYDNIQIITMHSDNYSQLSLGWLLPTITNISNREVKGVSIEHEISTQNAKLLNCSCK